MRRVYRESNFLTAGQTRIWSDASLIRGQEVRLWEITIHFDVKSPMLRLAQRWARLPRSQAPRRV